MYTELYYEKGNPLIYMTRYNRKKFLLIALFVTIGVILFIFGLKHFLNGSRKEKGNLMIYASKDEFQKAKKNLENNTVAKLNIDWTDLKLAINCIVEFIVNNKDWRWSIKPKIASNVFSSMLATIAIRLINDGKVDINKYEKFLEEHYNSDKRLNKRGLISKIRGMLANEQIVNRLGGGY